MERVPDSVWELPLDFDWTPQAVFDYIEANWHDDQENMGTLFSLAAGLYWHCADYHGGQFSERYRIQCRLNYSPGGSEISPGSEDWGTEEDLDSDGYVYDRLAE